MSAFCRLRRNKRYAACIDEVRVERRGKSSPDGSRVSVAVNSIRSNTAMGAIGLPGRSRGGLTAAATQRLDR